jgi:hypothetical protein
MTAPNLPDPRSWLKRQLQVMEATDREVIAVLKQARLDINRQLRVLESRGGIGTAVRSEQLRLAKAAILREQATLWRKLGDIIRARRLEAAERVIRSSQLVDQVALVALGGISDGAASARAIADAERSAVRGHLDRMIARAQGDSYIPLSDRVYRSETGLRSQLDRKINSALSRGLSAREFSAEVSQFINPFTPGGLRYAAMRLARTEINNAAHAVAVDAAKDKPWVAAMTWHLSASHPRPDRCDQLAHNGPYQPKEVPGKPHPHCFCFVTPELLPFKQFEANLLAGSYDGYLDRYRNLQPGQTILTRLG